MNKRPDNIALFCFMTAGVYFGYLILSDARFLLLMVPVSALFIFNNTRLFVSVFLAGVILFLIKNYDYSLNQDIRGKLSGKDISLSGFVHSANENKMSSSLVISADTLSVHERSYPVNMKFTAMLQIKNAVRGDRIRIKGKFREFKSPTNLYEKDMRKYGMINNVYGEVSDAKLIIYKRENSVWRKFSELQDGMTGIFERRLTYSAGNFLSAVMLGRRDRLDPAVIKEFAGSGTIHLLAVSGLHVGFLILILSMLSSIANLKGVYFIIINSAALLSYAVFTGASPSVIRAVLMAVILMLSKSMKRKLKFIDVIGSAGMISLLFEPNQIFNPGFILSFAAVASIAIIYQPVSEAVNKRFVIENYFLKKAFDGVMLSLLVTIGLLPFVLYIFGKYNFVSILSNVVMIPLTGAAFMGGIILMIFDRIGIVAEFIADIVDLICFLITKIASVTAEAELFTLKYKSGITAAAVLVGATIMIFYFVKYKYKLGLSAVLISFLAFQMFNVKNEPGIYVFHTDKAGSVMINSCGESIFIAGKLSTSEIRRIINPYILENNITALDYLITSEEWYSAEKMLSEISVPVKYIATDKDYSNLSGEAEILVLNYINRTIKFPGGIVHVSTDGNFQIITADNTIRSDEIFNSEKGIGYKIR